MSYLSWLRDEDLKAAVQKLVDSVRDSMQKSSVDLGRNVLDPFSILFNLALISGNIETWEKSELIRQQEKSLSNALGLFHQYIIAHVDGWKDPANEQSFDLYSEKKRIIVEMKNKYNTLNATGKVKVFNALFDAVTMKSSSFYKYKAYLVQIIPNKGAVGTSLFKVRDNNRNLELSHNDIYVIDGQSFYELATGHKNALLELLNVVPKVLNDLNIINVPCQSMKVLSDIYADVFPV